MKMILPLKIKPYVFAILAFSFVIFACAFTVRAQNGEVTGGYAEANVTDDVAAAAVFAVKKRAQNTRTTINLFSIKRAETQVVAGLNYKICIEVKFRRRAKGKDTQFVEVIVYRNLKNIYSLTSWTALKDSSGC